MCDSSRINSSHPFVSDNNPQKSESLPEANHVQDSSGEQVDIDDFGLRPIAVRGSRNIGDDSSIHLDESEDVAPQEELDDVVPQRLLDEDYKQLDELMKKAAKTSCKNVTFHDVQGYADTILNDPEQSKALNSLCANVVSSMTALNQLRGEELYTWKFFKGYVVNPAVTAAIDAQLALADAIRVLEGNCDPNDAKTLDNLALLRNRCEMRATEISHLAGEMRMYAEDKVRREASAQRLKQTVKAMLPEKAAEMHGTQDAIRHLEAFVAPLLVRLKAFENSDSRVRQTDLDSMRLEIRHMLQALEYAKKNGIDFGLEYDINREGAVTGDGKANGRVFVDADILDAMENYLNDKLTRLGQCRKSVGLKVMESFALSMLKKSPFEQLFKNILGTAMAPSAGQPALRAQYENYMTYQSMRGAILDFFRAPTKENMEALRTARRNAKWSTCNGKKFLDELADCARMLPSGKNRGDLEYFCHQIKTGQLKYFYRFHNHIERISDHLLTMYDLLEAQTDADFQKRLKQSDLVAIFQDSRMFSAVLEARIHGMQDGDANPEYSPSKLVSSEPLGHGAVNTVNKCVFRQDDGTTSVGIFKDEISSRDGVEYMAASVFTDYESAQSNFDLNIASSENARLFGVENVIAKSSVGVLNGKYGFYMEQAPGASPATLQEKGTASEGENGLTLAQIRRLNKADLRTLKGNLRREVSNLQWIDLINGQADRHGDNYFVHFRKDLTVRVTGIDNDAAFQTRRLGVGVFNLAGAPESGRVAYTMLEQSMLEVLGVFGPMDYTLQQMEDSQCVEFSSFYANGESKQVITRIDLNKCPKDNPAIRSILSHLLFNLGEKTLVYPSVIDQRLKDKFLEVYNSQQKLSAWETQLKRRMSDEAVAATIARFKDVCQHIQNMDSNDVIQSDEEWHRRNWKPRKSTTHSETRESAYMNQDFFDRDFISIF